MLDRAIHDGPWKRRQGAPVDSLSRTESDLRLLMMQHLVTGSASAVSGRVGSTRGPPRLICMPSQFTKSMWRQLRLSARQTVTASQHNGLRRRIWSMSKINKVEELRLAVIWRQEETCKRPQGAEHVRRSREQLPHAEMSLSLFRLFPHQVALPRVPFHRLNDRLCDQAFHPDRC